MPLPIVPFAFLRSQPWKRQPYATLWIGVFPCVSGARVGFLFLFFFFASLRVYRRLSTRGSPLDPPHENPIKRDMYWSVVLFKAFWDISTDVSFNVSAGKNKTKKKQQKKNIIGSSPPSILFSSSCLPFLVSPSPLLRISLHPFPPSSLSDAAQSSKLPFFPSLASWCVAIHGL